MIDISNLHYTQHLSLNQLATVKNIQPSTACDYLADGIRAGYGWHWHLLPLPRGLLRVLLDVLQGVLGTCWAVPSSLPIVYY